jgi:hypothetical protein
MTKALQYSKSIAVVASAICVLLVWGELKLTPVGASIPTAKSSKVDAEYDKGTRVPLTRLNMTERQHDQICADMVDQTT